MLRGILGVVAVLCGLLAAVWPAIPFRHQNLAVCPLGFGGDSRLPSPYNGDPHHTLRAPGSSSRLVLYRNTRVWTGEPGARSPAEAFAVDAATGRFAYVGTARGAPAAQRTEDLGGAHVVPGLCDAHLHLIDGGLALSRLDLASASSPRSLVRAVAAAAAKLPHGAWLLGGAWDESRWGGELPTAAWIDEFTPNTPVWLVRHDAHMGLANTAALRAAGIGPGTPDPPSGSGRILHDANGQPTGLLTDAAMALVGSAVPPLSVAQRREALAAAAAHALSRGITMVHDMGRVAFMAGEEAAWRDLEEVYMPAANEGRLQLRVHAFVALPTWRRMAERVAHLGRAHPGGRLWWGSMKEFADGSLGSRTALFHEPYADAPATAGTRTIELERLRQLVAAADGAGLQVAVHAIGDRAVDEVLGVYAALRANHSGGGGGAPRRHRIEHAQHLSAPHVAAGLAAAGVVVTPNPLHLLADEPVLEARLGPARSGAGRTYAFRTLLAAGVTMACGSDWPVVPLDALDSLHAAVHRRAPSSSKPAHAPTEALGVAEALTAHTLAGAEAVGLDRELGSIAVGKLADFVVLDGAPGQAATAVRQTFIDGRCMHGCDAR